MAKKYTPEDARARVIQARYGCLIEGRVTLLYLQALREEVSRWLVSIDAHIAYYTQGRRSSK